MTPGNLLETRRPFASTNHTFVGASSGIVSVPSFATVHAGTAAAMASLTWRLSYDAVAVNSTNSGKNSAANTAAGERLRNTSLRARPAPRRTCRCRRTAR
jgi:transglutaminase/protease-like cytokinesis protein 3